MEDAAVKHHKIKVIGIGPGNPDYMLPMARQVIREVKALTGGRRALSQYAASDQHTFAITRDIPGVMAFIREELRLHDVGVLVSGDPGYYSLLDALKKEFPEEYLQVIPGISSVQLAFARLALPWHDADLISLHGREPKEEELFYAKGRMLGMLTDGVYNSRSIAKLLVEIGWPPETRLSICLRLSYPDEEIINTTLQGAREIEEYSHGVLIVQG